MDRIGKIEHIAQRKKLIAVCVVCIMFFQLIPGYFELCLWIVFSSDIRMVLASVGGQSRAASIAYIGDPG